jgi:membrane-associated protein
VEWLTEIVGLILHLDQHLLEFTQNYGAWIYGLLFLIVFCETGLVVTPILPGDSLLFVAGALAAVSSATGEAVLNVHLVAGLLLVAAILGDSVNYGVGKWLGPRVFRMQDSWFFSRKYLEAAQAFYRKHGGKTIVIARFVPIIRTYAPFVAGVGAMDYRRFIGFNVGGALLWVLLLVYGGYFFGNLPWVKLHLSKVILGIVVLSILPGVIEYLRNRRSVS